MGDRRDFEVIVVGSGFGGSVMTCRLAEKGHSVCLLERGRRYGYGEFPRHTHEADRLFWDDEDGYRGLYDFNFFRKSDAYIVCGSGLGGGSLIYASVLMKMPPQFFSGWPGGLTLQKLDGYYERALEMLEASRYPVQQPYYADTPKTQMMVAAAPKLQSSGQARCLHPHLAVRFEGAFPGAQSPNKQGVIQSSCNKCGECDVGCNVRAKNTVDLNYIARAENPALLGPRGRPATVRTDAVVETIRPLDGGGYEVTYRDLGSADGKRLVKLTAEKVVVSAGTLGSTTLLLKMKHRGMLPNLSPMLGKHWCGNGDLEGTILELPADALPTSGPVITTALEYFFDAYPDGFPHGLYIQDGGLPAFLAWFLIGKMPSPSWFGKVGAFVVRVFQNLLGTRKEVRISDEARTLIDDDKFVRRGMILLGMGRDRSTGTLHVDDDGEVQLEWKMHDGSKYHYDHVREEMKRLASAMGGKFQVNPLTYANKVLAVHPLGGCVMADSAENGVVNTRGEAFGHPGLYVVDGSIIPTSTCVNPSLTIAAMAEYIAEQW